MILEFDIKKTIAAAAFLSQREGDELDMFLALKMLYLADKNSLINWGKTITGDSFVSLQKGPVLTRVCDLFKGRAHPSFQDQWNAAFSERVNHCIHLIKDVEIGVLSDREMEMLERSRVQIHEMAPWEVPDWLHETCSEWQNPLGSSLPINPDEILRNAGIGETAIQEIEKSNHAYSYMKKLLGV